MKLDLYTIYNEDEILRLYESVGWTAYTAAPEKLRKGFENSLFVLAAYDGDTLQGIVRVVGDGHTVVFIQDLLVFPEYQRRGVGSALLGAVLDKFRDVRQIELAANHDPKTIAFYKHMGLHEFSEYNCCGFMK